MHGGGTVSGWHVGALAMLKYCCAFAGEMQPQHQKGHQIHRKRRAKNPGRRAPFAPFAPPAADGEPVLSSAHGRASMISCASVSVTASVVRCAAASRSVLG